MAEYSGKKGACIAVIDWKREGLGAVAERRLLRMPEASVRSLVEVEPVTSSELLNVTVYTRAASGGGEIAGRAARPNWQRLGVAAGVVQSNGVSRRSGSESKCVSMAWAYE
jgi:hypothetical protein